MSWWIVVAVEIESQEPSADPDVAGVRPGGTGNAGWVGGGGEARSSDVSPCAVHLVAVRHGLSLTTFSYESSPPGMSPEISNVPRPVPARRDPLPWMLRGGRVRGALLQYEGLSFVGSDSWLDQIGFEIPVGNDKRREFSEWGIRILRACVGTWLVSGTCFEYRVQVVGRDIRESCRKSSKLMALWSMSNPARVACRGWSGNHRIANDCAWSVTCVCIFARLATHPDAPAIQNLSSALLCWLGPEIFPDAPLRNRNGPIYPSADQLAALCLAVSSCASVRPICTTCCPCARRGSWRCCS